MLFILTSFKKKFTLSSFNNKILLRFVWYELKEGKANLNKSHFKICFPIKSPPCVFPLYLIFILIKPIKKFSFLYTNLYLCSKRDDKTNHFKFPSQPNAADLSVISIILQHQDQTYLKSFQLLQNPNQVL